MELGIICLWIFTAITFVLSFIAFVTSNVYSMAPHRYHSNKNVTILLLIFCAIVYGGIVYCLICLRKIYVISVLCSMSLVFDIYSIILLVQGNKLLENPAVEEYFEFISLEQSMKVICSHGKELCVKDMDGNQIVLYLHEYLISYPKDQEISEAQKFRENYIQIRDDLMFIHISAEENNQKFSK